jgi:hypothetical protein
MDVSGPTRRHEKAPPGVTFFLQLAVFTVILTGNKKRELTPCGGQLPVVCSLRREQCLTVL